MKIITIKKLRSKNRKNCTISHAGRCIIGIKEIESKFGSIQKYNVWFKGENNPYILDEHTLISIR